MTKIQEENMICDMSLHTSRDMDAFLSMTQNLETKEELEFDHHITLNIF